jgi:hypothetical protein
MGILKRDVDGIYRHERGRVPWADRALDRIKIEDDEMARQKMNRKGKPRPVPNRKRAAQGGRKSSRRGVPNKAKRGSK